MSSQSNQEPNSNLNQTQLNCDFTIEEAKHLLSVMIKAKVLIQIEVIHIKMLMLILLIYFSNLFMI